MTDVARFSAAKGLATGADIGAGGNSNDVAFSGSVHRYWVSFESMPDQARTLMDQIEPPGADHIMGKPEARPVTKRSKETRDIYKVVDVWRITKRGSYDTN